MATEVAPPQQLLEAIGHADRVELDNTARELLYSTRVHIPMDVVLRVQELEPGHNLLKHV